MSKGMEWAREWNGSLPFHGHVWLTYENGMIHYFVLFGMRKRTNEWNTIH
ncbi:hypothetical protein HanPSC8_Chr01g0013841 [Helianthus annuus]|nr:hypothetical protein HanPSC8_Chr01g0013841 [Helianthus annuus]